MSNKNSNTSASYSFNKNFLYLGLMVFVFSFSVSAATSEEKFADLPGELVQSLMDMTRPHLSKAKLPNNDLVGKETPQELADPLLTQTEAEEAVVRGMISRAAEWCGLDWNKKSFAPFMTEKRDAGRQPKSIAYTAVLHGVGMGLMEKKQAGSECTPDIASRTKDFLY